MSRARPRGLPGPTCTALRNWPGGGSSLSRRLRTLWISLQLRLPPFKQASLARLEQQGSRAAAAEFVYPSRLLGPCPDVFTYLLRAAPLVVPSRPISPN